MQAGTLNTDPAALPLREIHLPDAVGWWPPAPGWWILPILVLLAAGIIWYSRLLYKRRRYSAINMARKELVRIKSRYAVDRDAGHCVRSVSGLLRRLCISVFPRAESAGLTGAEWLAFLQSGNRHSASIRHTGQGLSGIQSQGSRSGIQSQEGELGGREQCPKNKEPGVDGVMPENIGRLLLEAPYRRQVAREEVEDLMGFCSDWIESVARNSRQVMR